MCPLPPLLTGWRPATTTESSVYARSSSRSSRKRRSQMIATAPTAWSSPGWVCELCMCTHDHWTYAPWSLGAPRKDKTKSKDWGGYVYDLQAWANANANLRPLHARACHLWHWHYPLTMLTSPCVHPSGLFPHPFICSTISPLPWLQQIMD